MAAPFAAPISTVNITTGGKSQVLLAAADVNTPRSMVVIQPQTEACFALGYSAGRYISSRIWDRNGGQRPVPYA